MPAGRRLRRPGRRIGLLLAIAAALTAAAIAAVLLLRDGISDDGPLVTSRDAHASGLLAEAGEPLTYAGITFFNSAAEPAVLERVELVDPDEGIRVVGVLAGPAPESALIVAFGEFPPSPDQYPAPVVRDMNPLPIAGFLVPPQPRATFETARLTQVYVGLESTEPQGAVTVASLEVYYRVGERRYVLRVPQGVTICTPRDEWVGETLCPTYLPGER